MNEPNAARGGLLRWNRTTYLLLGVAGALLLASLVLRSTVLLFLALPLLIAPFAAPWGLPGHVRNVDLDWTESGAGSEVHLEGTVTGDLRGAAQDVRVRFALPPGARQPAPTVYTVARGAVGFRADWLLHEPTVVPVAPPSIVWEDPFGLSERELGGQRPGLLLERYPLGLGGLSNVRLDRTTQLPGETPSRRIGATGEFFGLRWAAPNEPVRRINWVATARVGRPLVNEFSLDRAGDLVVILDTRPTALDEPYDERLLGLGKAAAYGVVDAFLRGKVRVGFGEFGEFLEAIPLSTGRAHRLRVLTAIRNARLAEYPGVAVRCSYAMRRYFRPGVTTLVISSWAGELADELVPNLRRNGYPTVMLTPSPITIDDGSPALSPAEESVARGIARVDRRGRLAPLWQYGPVVDWEEHWTLANFVHYMHQPPRRRGS